MASSWPSVRLRKITASSMRPSSSWGKLRRTSAITSSRQRLSSCPWGVKPRLRRWVRYFAPTLEVIITTAFLKLALRPWESVSSPSSKS